MHVSLEKQRGEPLQKHAWHGWNKQALTGVAAVSFSGRIRTTLHRRRVQCKLSKH